MSATLDGIDRADERLAAYLQAHHVAVDVFGLRILLRESLLNAVTHGSGTNPSKTVTLIVELGATEVTLTVEDSGPGFAWANLEVGFDTLDGDGGRGIALMGIYSDGMSFNESGSRVVLKKTMRDPVPAGASLEDKTPEEKK